MSLICGILSRRNREWASRESLEAMLKVTRHRSRDGRELFLDPSDGVGLAHAHTATFGIAPEVPAWHQDETVVTAVDGDIYDDISTARDWVPSNVSKHAGAVVQNFRDNHAEFPAGLDGVFSLFLWDRQKKTLHLAADPLRHKLVYYYEDAPRELLVFSTELKAVLAHPAVPRQLAAAGIPAYLTLGYCPGQMTLARGVRKLQAAESISFAPGRREAKRYWRLEVTEKRAGGGFDAWLASVRAEVQSAVARNIGGARRVAVFLSGGAESSAILAGLRYGRPDVEAEALTLTFPGHRGEYDVSWAAEVARATGTPHRVIEVEPGNQVTQELASALFRQVDEPFESVTRVINESFLGNAALEDGFDSWLNGAQGAVLFSLRRARRLAEAGTPLDPLAEVLYEGYARTRFFDERRISRALEGPTDLSGLREGLLADLSLLSGLHPHQALPLNSVLQSSAKRETLFFQYIPPLLGAEERAPFLDTRFVASALSVPARFRGAETAAYDRALLRDCFRDALQIDFSEREKRGYPQPPLPAWFDAMLVPALKPLVDDGVLREDFWQKLGRDLAAGKKRARQDARQLFALASWYQFQIKETDPFAAAA